MIFHCIYLTDGILIDTNTQIGDGAFIYISNDDIGINTA